MHPQDVEIAELGALAGALVVQPKTAPSEMKASVQLALDTIARFSPQPNDAWLLAPADLPSLSTNTIDSLIEAYRASVAADSATIPRIWAPRHGGSRGHPVLFPWALSGEVANLNADQGINALLDRHAVSYFDSAADAVAEDLDTPADYQRLRTQHGM